MTHRILHLLLLTAVVGVAASCSKSQTEDIAQLQRQVSELGERVDKLSGTGRSHTGPITAGAIFIVKKGNRCKIAFKFPSRFAGRQGDELEFEVYNSCDQTVTVNVNEIVRNPNNGSQKASPFSSIAPAVNVPRDEMGIAKLTVDSALGPPAGSPRDRWTFRWTVNGQQSNDPELEVEY